MEAGYGTRHPTPTPLCTTNHCSLSAHHYQFTLSFTMPVAVPDTNYYAILELEDDATEEEIRMAYKKLVSWQLLSFHSLADSKNAGFEMAP